MADAATCALLLAGASITFAVTAGAVLKGWGGWLDLRRSQTMRRGDAMPVRSASRDDLAELRERVRKLEAIAIGIDY